MFWHRPLVHRDLRRSAKVLGLILFRMAQPPMQNVVRIDGKVVVTTEPPNILDIEEVTGSYNTTRQTLAREPAGAERS